MILRKTMKQQKMDKAVPRTDQRFPGISHASVHNDHRARGQLITDYARHVLNHPDEEKLMNELLTSNNEGARHRDLR